VLGWCNKTRSLESLGRVSEAMNSYKNYLAVAPVGADSHIKYCQKRLQILNATICPSVDQSKQTNNQTVDDGCKCGIEGCPEHEAVNGKVIIDNHPLGPIVN
jgi:hypothetical protein